LQWTAGTTIEKMPKMVLLKKPKTHLFKKDEFLMPNLTLLTSNLTLLMPNLTYLDVKFDVVDVKFDVT
jgi:hypothetical protein